MLGKPVSRRTRIPVEPIIRRLREGASEDDVLDGYARLTRENIQAAMRYAEGGYRTRRATMALSEASGPNGIT